MFPVPWVHLVVAEPHGPATRVSQDCIVKIFTSWCQNYLSSRRGGFYEACCPVKGSLICVVLLFIFLHEYNLFVFQKKTAQTAAVMDWEGGTCWWNLTNPYWELVDETSMDIWPGGGAAHGMLKASAPLWLQTGSAPPGGRRALQRLRDPSIVFYQSGGDALYRSYQQLIIIILNQ